MNSGKVNCGNCNNDVIPKLWKKNKESAFNERELEHVCPICGTSMYTSGGELTDLGRGVSAVVGTFIGIILIAAIIVWPFRAIGLDSPVTDVAAISGLAYLQYKYRVISRMWNFFKHPNSEN